MMPADHAAPRPASTLPALSIVFGLASPAVYLAARQLTGLIERPPGDETLFYAWLTAGLVVLALAAAGLVLGWAAVTRRRGSRGAAWLGLAINLAWIGTMAFHVVRAIANFQGR